MFDVNKMDDNFYLNFDDTFWLNKATIIEQLVDDEELKKKFGLDGNKNSDFLLKDLYMTKVHCCETLLRVFIVVNKHHLHPLIPLISIPSWKFNAEIKKITKSGIDTYLDSDKKLKDLFYPYTFSGSKDLEGLNLSLNFIKTAIELIANDYVEHKYYNALKHGFHGSTISDFSLSMNDPKTGKDLQVGKSDKMITWFELESDEILIECNSANSTQRDMNIIKIASSILSQLFNSQRAQIKKEDVHVVFFTKEALDNLKKLFRITEYGSTMINFKSKFSIKIPKELFEL